MRPNPQLAVPFSRIALDVVGPLPKSGRGHRFILVMVDYTTQFPEAIPLQSASVRAVARELFLIFSQVEIAKEILTDQGTCFMSKVVKALCTWLKVKQLRTPVYHPQMDGLVERFNYTLKQMLKKVGYMDGKNWDRLPYILFAIREVPQATMGYSPFELLYGRSPRGLLNLAKESWESQPSPHRLVVDHIDQMHVRMKKVWPLVCEHMEKAQARQAHTYNQGARIREFKPGEKVLVLIPTNECKFLAKWHGPYKVVEKVGPVNYRVRQPGWRKGHQVYHINLLKKWHTTETAPVPALVTTLTPQTEPPVVTGTDLSPSQVQGLRKLIGQSRDIFSELPGYTHVIAHGIDTKPGVVV